jgi:hypothetical protein
MDPDILGVWGNDEGMTVSIELVTMIVSVATTLLGLGAGSAWMIARTDSMFARFEQRVEAKFERFEQRVDAKFEKADQVEAERFAGVEARFVGVEARFDGIETRIAGIEADLGEVKVAIARLEGPTPRLLLSR